MIYKAARSELITKPSSALLAIKSGFKDFWNDLPKHSVSAIYEISCPTPEKIKAYVIYPAPYDKLEDRAFNYLQRFLEEADMCVLELFLRFVTSCTYILPGVQIMVSSELMSDSAARPTAKTCMKMVKIPRNFNTYFSFANNMKLYLSNVDHWAMED